MRNNEKNIENEMLEWKEENNGMEDNKKMVKNGEIG